MMYYYMYFEKGNNCSSFSSLQSDFCALSPLASKIRQLFDRTARITF